MSTARKAREWLAAQDGPRTSRQIADAIGGEPIKVQWAVGCMLRDGLLARVSAKKPCTYVVAREGRSNAECVALALEARRSKSATKAVEREAARVKAADARRVERERASAERKRLRVIARREYEKSRRRANATKFTARLAADLDVAAKQPPEPIRAQTVEEFMAMGGHVERLETNFRPRGVAP